MGNLEALRVKDVDLISFIWADEQRDGCNKIALFIICPLTLLLSPSLLSAEHIAERSSDPLSRL